MRTRPTILTIFLLGGWIALLIVTVHALQTLGGNAAIDLFFGDFQNPWRRQFNTDFVLHLLLFASWIFWRTESKATGLLLFMISAFCGGMFNILYVLIALVRAKGDVQRLLLGCHARPQA